MLCKGETLLRRRAGAVDTAHAADEVGGAALRLLHQLSDCVAAAEALARTSQPPLPLLRRAMAVWGPGWPRAGVGDPEARPRPHQQVPPPATGPLQLCDAVPCGVIDVCMCSYPSALHRFGGR